MVLRVVSPISTPLVVEDGQFELGVVNDGDLLTRHHVDEIAHLLTGEVGYSGFFDVVVGQVERVLHVRAEGHAKAGEFGAEDVDGGAVVLVLRSKPFIRLWRRRGFDVERHIRTLANLLGSPLNRL